MTVALAVWLFDTTIKGSLMILLVAALQRAIGRHVDPRFRHLLWVIVLLRLVVPVTPSSPLSLFNLLPARTPMAIMNPVAFHMAPHVGGERTALVEAVSMTAPRAMPRLNWLIGIWLLGAILIASRTLIASARMQRAVSRARRNHPGNVIECEFVKTPALHGLLRPVLLIPPGLSAEELRHVVLHETWHMKRMDVAVSWLLAAAQTLHWFNPLVWFAASRIKEERELSCDELALSLLEEEERPGYGRTILKLLERFRMAAPVPALVGIVNQKQKMKRRITMIATFTNRKRFTVLFLTLVFAVGAMALTDEKSARRTFLHKIDPAAAGTIEKLHTPISFELTSGSINDLLNTVANKTGVAIVQTPELSTLAVQQARFTVKAENVPAHAVLMEALAPFELAAEPGAEGVKVIDGANSRHAMRIHLDAPGHEELAITHEGSMEGKRVMKIVEGDAVKDAVVESDSPLETRRERIFIRKDAGKGKGFDKDGASHRELVLNISRNGVKTEGKLTIDITK